MRTWIAMWSIGLAVGLAVLIFKPSEPWRDVPATAPPPLELEAAGAAAATAALELRAPLSIEATERASRPVSSHEPIPNPALPMPNAARDPIPDAAATLAPARNDPPREAIADRIDRLIAAGFEPERAATVVRREAELRRAAYYAEYERSGTVRPFGTATRLEGAEQLRAELGDGEYERYLEALGQPTRVVIGMIEADTPAAHAGLLPDDEILAYDGRRIFNPRELNALMLEGSTGEIVATTIVRDGRTMELYVTRGPLGIVPRP